jgi:hypothetical protein
MSDKDPNDHIAQQFHGLISDLQRGDVERFEADQRKQAEARAALRRQVPNQGLSASELLKDMDGDPEEEKRKIQEELMRLNKEAQAAAAAKSPQNEPLPAEFFPPPPTST